MASESSTLDIRRQESLNFVGTVLDNYSLGEGGNGRMVLTYQGGWRSLFEAVEILWPESQGTGPAMTSLLRFRGP